MISFARSQYGKTHPLDHSRKSPGGVRAPREPKEVDLVAGAVVLHEVSIGVTDELVKVAASSAQSCTFREQYTYKAKPMSRICAPFCLNLPHAPDDSGRTVPNPEL